LLTELKAYSSWASAPTLLLNEAGRAETDLIQIRNIDGLDPVKASVGTSSLGDVDGSSYTGSSIPSRNIILTIGLNPNWDTWTYEGLRRLIYSYFMPKRPTRLVFYSDDLVPVEIAGITEGVTINQFSKDPELLVSVICPDPYFTALEPTVLTGSSGEIVNVDYSGSIETGIRVKVTSVSGPAPTVISLKGFNVEATVSSVLYFEMGSLPMQKFVQNVGIGSGVITNLLSKVEDGFSWPVIQPGINEFSVLTDSGVQDWELTYYERFGGL
jgi:Phage tail protein